MKNKGFSLIELIVVVSILAVLVGLITPLYLGYVEKTKKSSCIYSRDKLERKVFTEIAADETFLDFLNENYGIDNPNNITDEGGDISPLLERLNLSDYEICKSEGEITANFYISDDGKSYIFKILCSVHDELGNIPLIDFSEGNEKSSMKTMSDIIMDMYEYYVVGSYDDRTWKTEFNTTNTYYDENGEDYYLFQKFNGGWQDGGHYVYTKDMDNFIKETINENQYEDVLTLSSGGNGTQLYFENDNKDLTQNSVHSVFTYIDNKYYIYYKASDTLYEIDNDYHENTVLRVDESKVLELIDSGGANIVE